MGRGETNAKKRKRLSEALNGAVADEDASHRKVETPVKGRDWTLSVALPGSVVSSAQTPAQQLFIAGQIARSLAVFCVDEVVVYDDGDIRPPKKQKKGNGGTKAIASQDDPIHFLVLLLSYLETPPHLRKLLFPSNTSLEAANSLPNLELPHHLNSDEWCTYREGVTLSAMSDFGTLVDAGLRIPVRITDHVPENTRVTLKFGKGAEQVHSDAAEERILAEPVNPDEPREVGGYYWGFKVRRAGSLSKVFTECEYEDGYDISIGTSEKGDPIEDLYSNDEDKKIQNYKHMLVVYGGDLGLESAVQNDSELQELGVQEAKDAFDRWVNILPGQGSRTIRTEESIWIGLAGLKRLAKVND